MQQNVSDEAFARYVNQIGDATLDQIEAARAAEAESAKKGIHLSLGEVLVQQGILTQALRENIEKQLQAQQTKQLGPYKLIKKLGEGGMGAVYLAEDTSVGGKVAVKVLAKKYSEQGEFLTRFLREAQATGKLNHANIVTAYNVGEDAGTHYYAMEYCDGDTLDRILKREEYLPWDKAIAVTIQVARGLKHAHEQGIIHRDIKPANVFICRPLAPGGEGDGGEGDVFGEAFVAKILDLGLSKNIGSSEQSYLTQTGTALGTPHYMSPEQARGDKGIDGRTDIYSLGATLYNLVTGQTPFSGMSAGVVMMKHLSEQLPNPQDMNADIPDGVVQIIQKMMAKAPADRYANCAELLADLELACQGKQPSSVNLDPALTTIATRRKGAQDKVAARPRAARPGAAVVRKKAEPAPLEPVDETLVHKDAARGAAGDAHAAPGGRKRKTYLAAGAAALVLLVAAAALALRAKPETQNPKPEGNSTPETTATVTGTQAAKPETADLKPETKVWPLHNGKEPIADYAKRVGLPAAQELDLGGGVTMEFVLIPAGKFMMGSPETEKGRFADETQHEVTISKPFYMGKYSVTQEQYEAITGTNPSNFKGVKSPVENVSWEDAQEFCKKLSAKSGKTVQLPTEAQWEYACRAGTISAYYCGDEEADLARVAWRSLNSGGTTHPVGQKEPNAWVLYDMHGNVWEWCEDLFGEYPTGVATDRRGSRTGTGRVLRGGSWNSNPWVCRSAVRRSFTPDFRYNDIGFRLMLAGPP